jgi:uncharacterized membrane protein
MEATRTSRTAIAALALSILWGYGWLSIAGIILAIVAKRQIRDGGGTISGNGLATAALIIGILGVIGAVFLFFAVFNYSDPY